LDSSTIIFVLIIVLLQIFSYLVIIKKKEIFKFYEYKQIQKTHEGFTPRIGGLVIFLIFYLYLFIEKSPLSKDQIIIFFGSIVIISISTLEDLFSNIHAKIRLTVILFTSFIFVISQKELPIVNLFFLNNMFQYNFSYIFFYTLCIAIIANGINIIDGLNGHAPLNLISILICLIYLGNFELITYLEIYLLLVFLIIFFIFNFPYGKIFLGDAGANWLGWISAIYTIIFFTTNNHLNNWYAVIILFYPTMEVLFSFSRKLICGQSPFKPDLSHIHLKMYHYLKIPRANPVSTLVLSPLSLSPIFFLYFIETYSYSVFIFIVFQIFIYLTYFFLLPKPQKN